MHTFVIVALCCLPAAGLLLALWLTDVNREPSNELVHEQQDQPRQKPDAEFAPAA